MRSHRSATRSKRRGLRSGMTVVEVLIAIVVFAIGLLGLVGTAALVTRMNGAGSRSSHAAFVAQQEIEGLRAQAVTAAGCAALASGSDVQGIYQRNWTVTTVGSVQRVLLTVTYPARPNVTRVDSVGTTIKC